VFIGSCDGEIARILTESRCGVSVPPDDGEALAKQISTLASDPNALRAMGRAARELFEQRFDQLIALAAWREVLGV
jgi:glycosyltransferase involved in cell wall biosynthesis